MNDYWVKPIKEHKDIKLKCINAKSKKGALQKFCKIWKIKGEIHRFDKIVYTKGALELLNGKKI